MKKLFTLIAAALMAVSANAALESTTISEKNVDITKISGISDGTVTFKGSWDWHGGIYYNSGDPVISEDKKTVTDDNVSYGDASAFDYLIMEYSASTTDAQLVVQYNIDGTVASWGSANYNSGIGAALTSATGGKVVIKLDAEKKKTVNAIAVQDKGTAGTITITKIYWATEEEYKAVENTTTLEEGKTHTLAVDDGWADQTAPGLDVTGFDALVVEVASASNKCELTAQGVISGETGSYNALGTIKIAQSSEATTYVLDISSAEKISQYAFSNSGNSEATTVVITKIYVTNKSAKDVASAINTVKAAAETEDGVYYNLSGQRVAKPSKGLYIQNGKKVIVK